MTALHDPEETRLLERVRNNDPQAFSDLVSRYMRRAFSVAFRILRQKEDAEDLVQETFVTVHQKIHTFDMSRPFGPWFFRILVNRGLNARKARQVRQTEPIPIDSHSREASPADAYEQVELRDNLQEAFEALPEKQRMIVRLFELEGFSSAEIGEILNLSDGTVRWHLHQARGVLRGVLSPLRETY